MISILKSPTWVVPIQENRQVWLKGFVPWTCAQEFIDANAILFDEMEERPPAGLKAVSACVQRAQESMLEHTTCHENFKELVSNLLLCHLMEAGNEKHVLQLVAHDCRSRTASWWWSQHPPRPVGHQPMFVFE